jgi:hypothetical protein
MGFSTWFRDGILGHFRGTQLPILPGTIYLALHASDPGADDAATELPLGTGGYARIPVATNTSAWSAPVSSGDRRVIVNAGTLTGGTASANLNGGAEIQYVTLRTASTGGNQIANGTLGTPKTISAGEAITFPPGTVEILV